MKIHSRLFLFIAILVLAFPALILACGGEEPADSTSADGSRPTDDTGTSDGGGGDEELAKRYIALVKREAEVEDDLCYHEKIDEVCEEFGEWQEERYGDHLFEDDYLELSDKDKKGFLDRYEDLLDDLEDAGREFCR